MFIFLQLVENIVEKAIVTRTYKRMMEGEFLKLEKKSCPTKPCNIVHSSLAFIF